MTCVSFLDPHDRSSPLMRIGGESAAGRWTMTRIGLARRLIAGQRFYLSTPNGSAYLHAEFDGEDWSIQVDGDDTGAWLDSLPLCTPAPTPGRLPERWLL